MLAAFPLYDLPELRGATDALWAALARALREEGVAEVPDDLTRGRDLVELWTDPGLLFAQTCGYPLARSLSDRVRVLATPCYRARGCQGPTYRSFLVVPAGAPARRLADLRGACCAVNDPSSHSGMNALRAQVAPLARGGRFFGDIVPSGSHRSSLQRIAAGEADVAAVDCITFSLLERVDPALCAAVRILGETAPAPAPPYVTRRAAAPGDDLRMVLALGRVMSDASLADVRAALLLDRVHVLPEAAYAHFLRVEADAVRLGYPSVC